jgi:hypothetical protein
MSAVVTAIPQQLWRKGEEGPCPLHVAIQGMKEQVFCVEEHGVDDGSSSSSSGGSAIGRIFSSPQTLLKHLLEEQHRE